MIPLFGRTPIVRPKSESGDDFDPIQTKTIVSSEPGVVVVELTFLSFVGRVCEHWQGRVQRAEAAPVGKPQAAKRSEKV